MTACKIYTISRFSKTCQRWEIKQALTIMNEFPVTESTLKIVLKYNEFHSGREEMAFYLFQ